MRTKFILKIVFFLILLINVSAADAAGPKLKRICSSVNGDITLFWFPFTDVCDGVEKVIIYARTNPQTAYKVIDSFSFNNLNEYVHKSARNNYIGGNYFIQYVLNCGGRKIVTSDTLKIDITPPPAIDPDSVSVNTGDAVLGWTPSNAADVKGYIIYRTVGSQNFPVDTVFGKSATFYRIQGNGNPNAGSERYKIAVLDSCDNVSVSGNFHETIFLSISQDACKKEIYLNWSAYKGWANGADKYQVFASADNGKTFQNIGFAVGNENSFVYKNGLANTAYIFYVMALKKGATKITSSSNEVSIKTNFYMPLEHIFLKNVSVSGNSVKLSYYLSSTFELYYFIIKKGNDSLRLETFDTVFNRSAVFAADMEYEDKNINVEREVKYYQIEAYDKCGNLSGASNISRNILAKVIKIKGGRLISWNNYINFPGDVLKYEVYRTFHIGTGNGWQHIYTDGASTQFYIDTDSIADYSNDGVCYYIKAVEGTNGDNYFNSQSFSNRVCYFEDAYVQIPNAFLYNGVSPEFKPVMMFADPSRSSMKIYNRWGELIYSSTDLYKGWNGNLAGGSKAQEGVYFYQIQVTGFNNKLQTFSGTFTLL